MDIWSHLLQHMFRLVLAHTELKTTHARRDHSPQNTFYSSVPSSEKAERSSGQHGATPQQQLWGNMEYLLKTTTFIHTAGLTIWTMFERRRRGRSLLTMKNAGCSSSDRILFCLLPYARVFRIDIVFGFGRWLVFFWLLLQVYQVSFPVDLHDGMKGKGFF